MIYRVILCGVARYSFICANIIVLQYERKIKFEYVRLDGLSKGYENLSA